MKDLNKNTYQAADVVQWYQELNGITEAEKTVFNRHQDLLSKGTVLDIGIGGGRTTEFLRNKCGSYVGVDYSPQFVAYCRKKFPELDIRQADARDLSDFSAEGFDLVNFSFNGIDYSDHPGRTAILSGIHRILKKNGIFFFSTHNKDHHSFNTLPWRRKGAGFYYNLKTFLRFSPFLWRKFRNRKFEHFSPEYAIVNDHAHDYRLYTFYSTPEFIRKQLREHGFKAIQLLNSKGQECPDAGLDDWVYVVCQKQ